MLYQLWLLGTWNIPFIIILTCITALYAFLLRQSLKIFYQKVLLFLFSMSLLGVIVGSPLTSIIHLSSSLHMVQMSILYFIIPPIVLVGIPERLFKKFRKTPGIKQVGNLFPSPKMSLITFAALFLIYHFPMILNVLAANEIVHNGYQVLLFILAFGMWWPIAAPIQHKRLTKEQGKRYAFLSGLLLMPACLMFILYALFDGSSSSLHAQSSSSLCLPAQSGEASFLPPPFNTKIDQYAAGFFMMGLHKFSLMLTFKLKNTKREISP